MRKPYYVFDLDGTLVESLPGIAAGLNLALASLGKPTHSEQAIRGMIGKGATELCAQALGAKDSSELQAEQVQKLLQAFSREYAQTLDGDGTLVFDGIIPMLQELQTAGCKLAILSNKPQDPTERIAAAHFEGLSIAPVLGFSKDRFPRKPDPAALHFVAQQWGISTSEITLIGDSIHDAHTAHNAGSQLILVNWGYSTQEALLNWQAEHGTPIATSAENLAEILRRLRN
ncbi:MAG: HAD-IA family hydrolase [Akkermansia sp.]